MEDFAAELLQARNLGIGGTVELARRRDKRASEHNVAPRRFYSPQPVLLIEFRATNFRTKTHMWRQAVFVDAMKLVAVNIALAGVKAGPIEILFERERIERRRDIAGRAGIGVVAPGAAVHGMAAFS